MPVKFVCQCGKKLRAEEQDVNKRCRCKRCGRILRIPAVNEYLFQISNPMLPEDLPREITRRTEPIEGIPNQDSAYEETSQSYDDSTEPVRSNGLSLRLVLTVIGLPAILGVGIILAVIIHESGKVLPTSDHATTNPDDPSSRKRTSSSTLQEATRGSGNDVSEDTTQAVKATTDSDDALPRKRRPSNMPEGGAEASGSGVPNDSTKTIKKGLTSEEVRLLTLASIRYYHNGDLVENRPDLKDIDLLIQQALKPKADGLSRIANCILFEQRLGATFADIKDKRAAKLRELSDEMYKVAWHGVLAGLQRRDVPTFDEFRRGPGQAAEAWLDAMRELDVFKRRVKVWISLTDHAIANSVESTFRPKLGQARLPTRDLMTIYPRLRDEVGLINGYIPSIIGGWFLRLNYHGTAPITNVVIIGRLQTTGVSADLSPDQSGVLVFNAATGYGDKNQAIKALYGVINMYNTIPKAGYIYVPILRPGDVIHVPLQEVEPRVLVGGSFSLHCDQGYQPEQKLELPLPTIHGEDYLALTNQIKHGITKAATWRILGRGERIEPKEWVGDPVPSFGDLPEDTDYYRWGFSQGVLMIGFSNEKVVVTQFLTWSQRIKLICPEVAKHISIGMPAMQALKILYRRCRLGLWSPIYNNQWSPTLRAAIGDPLQNTRYYRFGDTSTFIVIGFSNDKVVMMRFIEEGPVYRAR